MSCQDDDMDVLDLPSDVQHDSVQAIMTNAVSQIQAPALTAVSDRPITIVGRRAATYVLSNYESQDLAGNIMKMDEVKFSRKCSTDQKS